MVPARDAPSNRFEVQVCQLASGLSARAQGKIMPQAFGRAIDAFKLIAPRRGMTAGFQELFEGCRGRMLNDLGCHRFHMEDDRAQVTIIRLVRQ